MKSWIEISAANLRANFATVGAAAPGADVLCVLKANAYGHGARLCAPTLVAAGARWLGVADLEEGIAVRQAVAGLGYTDRDLQVVVMCGFEPQDALGLIEHRLTPVVWTPEHVQVLDRAASRLARTVPVHLEVDSGMSRQGATPGRVLSQVLEALGTCSCVRFEGIFSHLGCSEVLGSPKTEAQKQRFAQALQQTEDFPGLQRPDFLHFDNSAAVDSAATLDWLTSHAAGTSMQRLVRPGLALYGYTLPLVGAGTAQPHLSAQLQPVATWKTRITGLREVAAGDTVGYGATFTATRPMRLALLPVGYADGFRREASSGMGDGWVMVADQRAPVVGRVSMNLTVVDVTDHIPEPNLGDEVVLLGNGVTAQDHAHWANTIPYEILCGLRSHHHLV